MSLLLYQMRDTTQAIQPNPHSSEHQDEYDWEMTRKIWSDKKSARKQTEKICKSMCAANSQNVS